MLSVANDKFKPVWVEPKSNFKIKRSPDVDTNLDKNFVTKFTDRRATERGYRKES